MPQDAEKIIIALTPAIQQKCKEIQRKRQERRWTLLFVLLCLAVIFIPTILVFLGFSLTTFLLPTLLIAAALLLLAPILLHQQGGSNHECI